LTGALRVSRRIGSELLHLIRSTHLERRASSKSDGYLTDVMADWTQI